MRARTIMLLAVLALVCAVSAQAADITGKWIAQVPGRDGQTRETTFNFKGKVSGDEIKFTRQREGADQSQEFTAKRAQ